MSACPESEYRAAMSDGDFWNYVLNGVRPGDPLPDQWEPWDDEEPDPLADSPCPECGQIGACSYDAEGRPLIHAL